MEGVIKKKLSNGYVFIMSDEQEEFITHEHELKFKAKEGRRVSFDRGENPAEDGKYPWADNVQRLEFYADYQTGYGEKADWLILPVKMRKTQVKIDWCRCSYCGECSTNASNFCPKCGARMNRTEGIQRLAKEVYESVNETDGEEIE